MATMVSLTIGIISLFGIISITNSVPINTDTYRVSTQYQTASTITLGLTKSGTWTIYGADISLLNVFVTPESTSRLHVRITDSRNARWEVPQWIVPRPQGDSGIPFTECQLQFTYTMNPFSFAISRTFSREVIFNTSSDGSFNGLVFENQYLEISTQLEPNANIYGFGEQVSSFRWNRTEASSRTLWSLDEGTPVDRNLYASHPFYMQLSASSQKAHGVLLLNSNGMDVFLNPTSLTYKVIGGIFDFYFFDGPSPNEVIQSYHMLIGRPRLPPYWSLGWHQCRWGYESLDEVQQVVANYSAAKIPLDTMWTDIDYMDNYLDFTTDPNRFPGAQMTQFVNELHANDQHYVVIVDPGIHNQTGYAPYDSGLQQNLFIKNPNGTPFIGRVWPGTTAFPDWFVGNVTSQWWKTNIAQFRETVPVDGLWIDMNEISNFCSGDCDFPPTNNSLNFPPYRINNGGNGSANSLPWRTLSMDSVHSGSVLEYDAHSLFGISEAIATCSALESLREERCFVLSRSTFPGHGAHAGHWLGDNESTFKDMYYSIPGILSMQMFGIPLVGADICGFGGNTTEELCGRWMALGSLYPFARNHNVQGASSQEPYRWDSVAQISRQFLALRYALLPFYYSLFAEATFSGGAQVWQPLFFQFYNDVNTYSIDSQFLIGGAILVTPPLLENVSSVVGYFPQTNPMNQSVVWYDFFSGALLSVPASGFVSLDAPMGTLPMHLLGGSAILMQQPELTTAATRRNSFALVCALDSRGFCSGQAYQDDGISLPNQSTSKNVTLLMFHGSYASSNAEGTIAAIPLQSDYQLPNLETITIFGVPKAPTTVTVNSNAISSFSYSASEGVLSISSLSVNLLGVWRVQWK